MLEDYVHIWSPWDAARHGAPDPVHLVYNLEMALFGSGRTQGLEWLRDTIRNILLLAMSDSGADEGDSASPLTLTIKDALPKLQRHTVRLRTCPLHCETLVG